MNLYQSSEIQPWEIRQLLYEETCDYLIQFPWQYHAILTFPMEYTYFPANRALVRWLDKIERHERTRIAACRMSSVKRGLLHFHVLLFGLNHNGERCERRFIRKWESEWAHIARLRKIDDNFRVCDYVAKHYLGFKSDYAEIDFYNEDLLFELTRQNHVCIS